MNNTMKTTNETTKQAKHTPGPWYTNSGYIWGDCNNNRAVDVAEICGDIGERNLADARLIASAPELLEALKSVSNCNDYCNNLGQLSYEFKECLKLVEKAISKATGNGGE